MPVLIIIKNIFNRKKVEIIEKNPSQIGLETELKCQHFLISQGFDVLIPLGNYLKYDLVITKDKKFYKIQIKHAHQKSKNSFSINTKYDKRENGKVIKQAYQKDDIDYFLTEFNDQYYMFPVFETNETRLWLKESGHKLSTKKYADDYLAEDILSTLT